MPNTTGQIIFGQHAQLHFTSVPANAANKQFDFISGSIMSASGSYSADLDTGGYSAISVDFMASNTPTGSALYLIQNSLTPGVPITSTTGSAITGSAVQTLSLSPLNGGSTCTFKITVPTGQFISCSVADIRGL